MPYAILWNLMPTYTSSPLLFTYAVPLTALPFLVFSIDYLIYTYLSRLLNCAFSRKPILAFPIHFLFLTIQAVPVSHLSITEYWNSFHICCPHGFLSPLYTDSGPYSTLNPDPSTVPASSQWMLRTFRKNSRKKRESWRKSIERGSDREKVSIWWLLSRNTQSVPDSMCQANGIEIELLYII